MVGFKRVKYQTVQYLMQRFLLPCSDPDLELLPVLKKDFHPLAIGLGHPCLVSPQKEDSVSCKILHLFKN